MKYPINKVLSNGYTIGIVKTLNNIINDNKGNIQEEIDKFNRAIELSLSQINDMKLKEISLNEYLSIQELMINDVELHKLSKDKINSGYSAIDAINITMEEFINPLKYSSDSYLKERVADIEDVRIRLINNINNTLNKISTNKYILYVDMLLPSHLINDHNSILGVIAKKGGYTSHAAIMCRSWDIPYVISDIELINNQEIIIDTRLKAVIVNPTNKQIHHYKKEIDTQNKLEKRAIPHSDFLFLANISNNTDINRVLDYGFDGVGLYRTELIFMNNNQALSFDQQYKIYQEAVEACKDKPICFRTFDISDDKQLSYLKSYKKAIDNYKNNPQLFKDQITALLKANIYDNMRIMFPMIDSNDEFEYLKNWILDIQKSHRYNIPKIGVNIETKQSLEKYYTFDKVDFIAIGTNDLLSEIYGIDREDTDFKLEEYIDDLIIKIKPLINFCNEKDICLSVCGEIASIKEFAVKLYEAGIKNLSVSPSSIRQLNLSYQEYINKP